MKCKTNWVIVVICRNFHSGLGMNGPSNIFLEKLQFICFTHRHSSEAIQYTSHLFAYKIELLYYHRLSYE